MQPQLQTISSKKLIGKKIIMSLNNNKTLQLWNSFMPRRKEINNNPGSELFSVRVYQQPSDIADFNKEHEKWALIEVPDFNIVPEGMETFTLAGGLYAVFHYKGLNTDSAIYRYIYGEWISQSEYVLDHRPHFEKIGEKYKNNDPNSEEEIWIPIKQKE